MMRLGSKGELSAFGGGGLVRARRVRVCPTHAQFQGEQEVLGGIPLAIRGGYPVNGVEVLLFSVGMALSLVWVMRSRVPEAVAIRVRAIALDLEETLRDWKRIER